MIGKKWIYLERNALHRVWALRRCERASIYGVVSVYELDNFIG